MNAMVLRPSSFNELVQFAQMAAKSSMVPPVYKGKPEDIMLAVQMGSELGLAPMQSIQNIACVNGRPSVYGDAIPGLCKASPFYDDLIETFEHEDKPDQMAAVCIAKRKGSTPVTARFSVADAKKAGLWNKQGPWTQYPKRMLQMRARGFACRDAFPDVLRGLISTEEAADIAVTPSGPVIEARVEPEAPPAQQTFIERVEDALSNEPNGTKWLKVLQAALSTAPTMDDVAAIRGFHSVLTAQKSAPHAIRTIIQEAFTAAVDRLSPQHEPEAETPDNTFPGDMPNTDADEEVMAASIKDDIDGCDSLGDLIEWQKGPMKLVIAGLRKTHPKIYTQIMGWMDKRHAELEAKE